MQQHTSNISLRMLPEPFKPARGVHTQVFTHKSFHVPSEAFLALHVGIHCQKAADDFLALHVLLALYVLVESIAKKSALAFWRCMCPMTPFWRCMCFGMPFGRCMCSVKMRPIGNSQRCGELWGMGCALRCFLALYVPCQILGIYSQ